MGTPAATEPSPEYFRFFLLNCSQCHSVFECPAFDESDVTILGSPIDCQGDACQTAIVVDGASVSGRLVDNGSFKYVEYTVPGQAPGLFDMVNDPHDQNNLIEDPAQGALLGELKNKFAEWPADAIPAAPAAQPVEAIAVPKVTAPAPVAAPDNPPKPAAAPAALPPAPTQIKLPEPNAPAAPVAPTPPDPKAKTATGAPPVPSKPSPPAVPAKPSVLPVPKPGSTKIGLPGLPPASGDTPKPPSPPKPPAPPVPKPGATKTDLPKASEDAPTPPPPGA